MPLVVIENNKVVPLAAFMSLCGAGGIISHNGSLYFCMYSQGPDAVSGAATNKMYYNIYILKSDDDARTWYYYSQIVTAPEYFTACPEMEGFCEPQMRRMPDGSFVMLMRTGSYLPSYISHCYDDCRTWSKPEPFDTTGVFPQLLTLDCGITLATYGRPKLFVRATSDPSGKTWDEPRRIELSDDTKERASCCYTALLPLDAHTALLAYSDFYYPNAEGIPVKSMMTRKITVGI